MTHSFTHRANSDYTVVDRNPLHLLVGETVRLGPIDASWPGWVWVSRPDGRGSFVPEDHLDQGGPTEALVVKEFNARDLSVKRHECIIALREVKGWLWCRNEAGDEGWLPEFVLEIH